MSMEKFIFGKIDIRAAIPTEKIYSVLLLIENDLETNKNVVGDFFINYLKNNNYKYIIFLQGEAYFYKEADYRVYYVFHPNETYSGIASFDYVQQFHVYSFEWNKTDLNIVIDNDVIKSYDIKQKDTFLNGHVRIHIYLDVNEKISHGKY